MTQEIENKPFRNNNADPALDIAANFTNLKFECTMYTQVDYRQQNAYHFVTITNPSRDGINFIWSNRVMSWKLTAKFNEEGVLYGFDTDESCPY